MYRHTLKGQASGITPHSSILPVLARKPRLGTQGTLSHQYRNWSDPRLKIEVRVASGKSWLQPPCMVTKRTQAIKTTFVERPYSCPCTRHFLGGEISFKRQRQPEQITCTSPSANRFLALKLTLSAVTPFNCAEVWANWLDSSCVVQPRAHLTKVCLK